MNNKLALTTFAIAATGLALATSAPTRASNSLLDRCQNEGSRYVVEKCCSAWFKQKGKPLWFGDSGSCQNVVACAKQSNYPSIAAVAVIPKCKIDMPFPTGGGGGNGPLGLGGSGGKPSINSNTGVLR